MDPPEILGNAGLTGRQPVRAPEDPAPLDEPIVWEARQAMPPNCLRVFQSPRTRDCDESGGHGFSGPCVGLQEDGSCLLAIVRRAQAQQVEWKFEVYWDEWGNQSWRYAGPPLQ